MNANTAWDIWKPWVVSAACLSLLTFGPAGCEEDDDYKDHDIPAGKGSLVVQNRTADDIDVFVDGALVSRVDDDDEGAFDLAPGFRRVVLVEKDGDRDWRRDVDILDQRFTVLRVTFDLSDNDTYDVNIDVD